MPLKTLEMIAIAEEDRDRVRRAIRDLLPGARISVFGSRLCRDSRPDSDLDLAIDTGSPIPFAVLAELDDTFLMSSLPYTVDIVDWQRIDDDFREHILLKCTTL